MKQTLYCLFLSLVFLAEIAIKFNQSFYQKAQSYAASNSFPYNELNWEEDFSQFSNKIDAGIRKKMGEILELENNSNLSTEDMAKILQEKSDKGEVTSTEVIFLHTYPKGQLISKCPLGVIVSTKKPTKFF